MSHSLLRKIAYILSLLLPALAWSQSGQAPDYYLDAPSTLSSTVQCGDESGNTTLRCPKVLLMQHLLNNRGATVFGAQEPRQVCKKYQDAGFKSADELQRYFEQDPAYRLGTQPGSISSDSCVSAARTPGQMYSLDMSDKKAAVADYYIGMKRMRNAYLSTLQQIASIDSLKKQPMLDKTNCEVSWIPEASAWCERTRRCPEQGGNFELAQDSQKAYAETTQLQNEIATVKARTMSTSQYGAPVQGPVSDADQKIIDEKQSRIDEIQSLYPWTTGSVFKKEVDSATNGKSPDEISDPQKTKTEVFSRALWDQSSSTRESLQQRLWLLNRAVRCLNPTQGSPTDMSPEDCKDFDSVFDSTAKVSQINPDGFPEGSAARKAANDFNAGVCLADAREKKHSQDAVADAVVIGTALAATSFITAPITAAAGTTATILTEAAGASLNLAFLGSATVNAYNTCTPQLSNYTKAASEIIHTSESACPLPPQSSIAVTQRNLKACVSSGAFVLGAAVPFGVTGARAIAQTLRGVSVVDDEGMVAGSVAEGEAGKMSDAAPGKTETASASSSAKEVAATEIPSSRSPEMQEADQRLKDAGMLEDAPFQSLSRNTIDWNGPDSIWKKIGKLGATANKGPLKELMDGKATKGISIRGHEILAAKPAREMSYFVDKNGTFYISEKPIDFSKLNPEGIIRNTDAGSATLSVKPIEGGTIHVDAEGKIENEVQFKTDGNPLDPDASTSASKRPLTKDQVLSCGKKVNMGTNPLVFVGIPIAVDATMQLGTMAFSGQFGSSLGRTNAYARLGWVIVVDSLMKYLDAYLIDRVTNVMVPIVIKYPVNKMTELLNDKWNHLFVAAAVKLGAQIPEKDLDRAKYLSSATAQANYNANRIQKVLIGTVIDYYLMKKFPGQLMALCQENPKYMILANELNIRLVERGVGGYLAGMYVNSKTLCLVHPESCTNGTPNPVSVPKK